jgi:imidazolonepropionase-like amidohydrolase
MTLLLRPERIYDGDGGLLQEHGVLLRDGLVARVAPLGEFDGYAGAARDLPGGSLLPGLIDCHVHLCFGAEPNPGEAVQRLGPGEITLRALENAQRTLAGGITAVRDCGGQNYLEFAVRDACNAGRQRGPTIRAAGRMICMTGGHGNRFGRIADGVDEVIKAVREQVHAGSDLIKIMATGGVMTPGVNPEDAHYSAEEMAAGIAEGHRFHKSCASHAQGTEGILNAVRGGIDSIEHGFFMSEHCVEEMVQRGTFLVPTLAALGNILGPSKQQVPDYVVEKAERTTEAHRRSVMLFHSAGGRIAMGTDAGTPFNHHGGNAEELRYMVETGLTPMQAIVAATGNAADLMRLPDRGRVREGAVADLLLVNGDPGQDIGAVAHTSQHHCVIQGGVVVHDSGAAVAAEALSDAAQ